MWAADALFLCGCWASCWIRYGSHLATNFIFLVWCCPCWSDKLQNKNAELLQGEPRDAAVNFDTYRILQRYRTVVRAVSLPQHGFLIGLCLQTAVNHDHSQLLELSLLIANVMVVINRTRKVRCQKARVLLHFVTHSCCRLRRVLRCTLRGHPPGTTKSKQRVSYFTQPG